MKTVFDFFSPFRGKVYSHVNPWYAAMEHFTDEIGWKSHVPVAGRAGFRSRRTHIPTTHRKTKS